MSWVGVGVLTIDKIDKIDGKVGHPNGIESCQKSIGTLTCNLAISFNNWQHSLVLLDTRTKQTNKQTKLWYIEAACCLKTQASWVPRFQFDGPFLDEKSNF